MDITRSDEDRGPYLLTDDYFDNWLILLGLRHVSEETIEKASQLIYIFLFSIYASANR